MLQAYSAPQCINNSSDPLHSPSAADSDRSTRGVQRSTESVANLLPKMKSDPHRQGEGAADGAVTRLAEHDISSDENVDEVYEEVAKQFKSMELKDMKWLGSGGQGVVYQVETEGSKNVFAVKIIKQNIKGENLRSASNLLRREIHRMQSFDHNNVMKLLLPFLYKGNPAFIMPVASTSLKGFFLRKPANSYMPPNYLKDLVISVCEGVNYLHDKNLIHRDIKPDNILLVDNVWKIADFGLMVEVADKTVSGERQGTVRYWSPEVYNWKGHSRESDCWAVGITLTKAIAPSPRIYYCSKKTDGTAYLCYKNHQEFENKLLNLQVCELVTNGSGKHSIKLVTLKEKLYRGFSQFFGENNKPVAEKIRKLPLHGRYLVYMAGLLKENPEKRITLSQVLEWFKT